MIHQKLHWHRGEGWGVCRVSMLLVRAGIPFWDTLVMLLLFPKSMRTHLECLPAHLPFFFQHMVF